MKKGFVFLPLLIVVAIVAVAGGGYYYLNKQKGINPSSQEPTATITPENSPTQTVTPTNSPTPSPKPTIKPVTKTPTQTVTPTTVSANTPNCPYLFNDPTGAIKVIFTSKTNYEITWKRVEIYAQSGCKTLNNKSTDKYETDIYTNSGEASFGQVVAGPYSVRIRYGDGSWTGMYNVDAVVGKTTNLNIEIP